MSSDLTHIDFSQGLRHCDGLQELYRDVLICYLDQFRPLLNADTLVNDYDTARLQLHTIKSLSATIGAKGLSDMAAQLFKNWQQKDLKQRTEAIRQVNEHLIVINKKVDDYCNNLTMTD